MSIKLITQKDFNRPNSIHHLNLNNFNENIRNNNYSLIYTGNNNKYVIENNKINNNNIKNSVNTNNSSDICNNGNFSYISDCVIKNNNKISHEIKQNAQKLTTTKVRKHVININSNSNYSHCHRHHFNQRTYHHQQQHYINNTTTTTATTSSRNSVINCELNDTTKALNMRKSFIGSDANNTSFSSASITGSLQDDNMSDQCSLTQAGLEEYNSRSFYDQPVFHHQKQSSYAQSEGYHSYVSSSDSSSATPFLDRLRQESELLSRQSHHWSQNDLSTPSNTNSGGSINTGRNGENVVDASITGSTVGGLGENFNSSESTSSTETLKWLGSMSDVSVASHATSSSAISGSVSSSSQLIVHSSRVRTPKRHNSESVLYMSDDQINMTNNVNLLDNSSTGNGTKSSQQQQQSVYLPTLSQQQQQPQHIHYHQHQTIIVHSKEIKVGGNGVGDGSSFIDAKNNSSTSSSSTANNNNNGSNCNISSTISVTSPSNLSSVNSMMVMTSATATSSSSSSPSSSSYRNNHRLFPISTYTEPLHNSNASGTDSQQQQQQPSPQYQQSPNHPPGNPKINSPQNHNWQSVADRICDFERQQQHLSTIHHYHSIQQHSHSLQKYTYIDPSKTHRVPNPTLKAFQKNAVQSYFERQQQSAKENNKNNNYLQLNTNTVTRPNALQQQNNPAKELIFPLLRTSISNNYHQIPSPIPHSQQRSPGSQKLVSSTNSTMAVLSSSSLIIPSQKIDEGSFSDCGIPPPPPPRSRSLMPIRRSSSASDYADFRDNFLRTKEKQNFTAKETHHVITSVSSPEKSSFNDCGVPPPPPPPRGKTSMPIRRTSSASEYIAIRDKHMQSKQNFSKDLLGPMILGPIISVDDWVPERPPKNPHLRIPSPDLPPPPIQTHENEVILINQDEPLPPPPPEILRYVRNTPENEQQKPPSPSRRNSFAGSPSRNSFYRTTTFENLASPPSIPKKPSPNIEMMQLRPASSLAQSHKAHKVILNGKLEGHPQQICEQNSRGNDARISMRKRTHNVVNATFVNDNTSPTKLSPIHNIKSPPPLKPRMPIAGQEMRASSVAISNKLRCNSKASYLPRQSRDKLNTTDPDHGSYKLTLTSNEDSIQQQNSTSTTNYHDTNDILTSASSSNFSSNLPDILPANAKVHQQHQQSSPSSSGSSPRYGSNSNIASSLVTSSTITSPHTAPAIISSCYPSKSIFHFQSASVNRQSQSSPITQNYQRGISKMTPPLPATTTIQTSTITSTAITTILTSTPSTSITTLQPVSTNTTPLLLSSSLLPNSLSDHNNQKFMSQSTIDLKKTHILESNDIHNTKTLSESDNNINVTQQSISPHSLGRRSDLHNTETVRKLSLEERDKNEGRLVRAELVNTILSASPPTSNASSLLITSTNKSNERVIRKESLRENIEKITQLQSKLMSAHVIENCGERKLLGYTAKTVEVSAKQIMEKESPLIVSTSTSSVIRELKFSPNLDIKKNQQLSTHSPLKLESPLKLPLSSVPAIELTSSSSSNLPTSPISKNLVISPASSSFSTSSIQTTSCISSPSSSTSIQSSLPSSLEMDKISQMDSEIDGLKLMQRTEIILRLNAPTSEASSQTDDTLENDFSRIKMTENQNINNIDKLIYNKLIHNNIKILKPRQLLPEEIDCDNLSQDLVNKLSPTDKLFQILSPKVYKKSSDYISELYNLNLTVPNKIKTNESSTIATTTAKSTITTKRDVGTSTPNDKFIGCESNELTPSLSLKKEPYVTESKMVVCSSELLDSNKLSNQQHQQQQQNIEVHVMSNNPNNERENDKREKYSECCDLNKKKEELVNRLTKKITMLNNEQIIIGEEIATNEKLGNNLATKISEKMRPIDATKFRAYIDDVGHITMLLLSLSGRLAKTENTLRSMNENQAEKKILELKRSRLLEQLEEAKHLKEDIDRRGIIVGNILEKNLTKEEYAEYHLFINMKTKLIVDSREIADKIKLSEEQLIALKDVLIQSEC